MPSFELILKYNENGTYEATIIKDGIDYNTSGVGIDSEKRIEELTIKLIHSALNK